MSGFAWENPEEGKIIKRVHGADFDKDGNIIPPKNSKNKWTKKDQKKADESKLFHQHKPTK